MGISPTSAVAVALPKLPTAAATTDVRALPASFAPVETEGQYDAHALVLPAYATPGDVADESDTYPLRGLVLDRNEPDQDEYIAPVRKVAAGSSLDATIAAAAQFSHEVQAHDGWGNEATATAIGVFQAKEGSFYLGSLWWNSAQNGNNHPVSMERGDVATALTDDLVAVVTDSSIARFDMRSGADHIDV